jgi:hypothetical protein
MAKRIESPFEGKNYLSFPKHGGSRIRANGPRIVVRVHKVKAVTDPTKVAHEVIIDVDGETASRIYDTAAEVKGFLDGVAALGATINAAMCDTSNHESSAREWHASRVIASGKASAPSLIVPPPPPAVRPPGSR